MNVRTNHKKNHVGMATNIRKSRRQKKSRRDLKANVAWAFQKLPISCLIYILCCILLVGLSYISELEPGWVLIVFSALAYIYLLIRYVHIGVRLYSKIGVGVKTSILVVVDLKFLEYFTIAGIITGMFFIDPTPNKTRFIQHDGFSAKDNPFAIWGYIISDTIFIVRGTGFSTVLVPHLATAIIYATGTAIAQLSQLILLAAIAGYWVKYYRKWVKKRDVKRQVL